jgi:uncharacterized protein
MDIVEQGPRPAARPIPLTRRRLLLTAGLGVAAVAGGAGALAWSRRSGADPAVAAAPAELRLATGPPGAVYTVVGGELVKLLAARFPRSRVVEVRTDGSVDNLALLADRKAELGFAHVDSTREALQAKRPVDVTAVARLYDAWMQVIVLAESPVRRFADLHRRPVTAGGAGSGSLFASTRLAAVAGIEPRFLDAVQADGATLLAAGKVDAMMTMTGIPTPAVTRLAAQRDLRMIPLDEYTAEIERSFGGMYTPAALPSSVYQGVEATETLTTPTLLLACPGLPDSVVEVVARTLIAERAQIARGHAGAIGINDRTAISTEPVRLHPGAVNYFRSVKP